MTRQHRLNVSLTEFVATTVPFIPDLFVFNAIIVELKSVKELISDHEAQLFNYMRIARQPVGYLLNFGHQNELQWKRFILSDLRLSDD